jgi:hypothetical protein
MHYTKGVTFVEARHKIYKGWSTVARDDDELQ